jgi:hypothetical protein
MKVNLVERSRQLGHFEADEFIETFVVFIQKIVAQYYLKDLIGNSQEGQRKIIKKFEKFIKYILNEYYNDKQINWEKEKSASKEYRDRYDIFSEIKLDNILY